MVEIEVTLCTRVCVVCVYQKEEWQKKAPACVCVYIFHCEFRNYQICIRHSITLTLLFRNCFFLVEVSNEQTKLVILGTCIMLGSSNNEIYHKTYFLPLSHREVLHFPSKFNSTYFSNLIRVDGKGS